MSNDATPRSNLPGKVAAVVAMSVALSVAVTIGLSLAFGSGVTLVTLTIAVLCPALVAAPVSYAMMRQAEQLAQIHSRLKSTHSRLEEAHKLLADRSRHDQMTGLINRETFLETISPGRRRSDGGFLLIIDADHFKQINDSHGHLTGDRALVAISAAIVANVREDDVAARIGGEEFAVFLPGASLAETIAVSERICRAVEDIDFRCDAGQRIALTVSIGGAESVGNRPADHLLGKADRMLYEAKSTGRNRALVIPEIARAA